MRFIIAGCGIGGLAAAKALTLQGHSVVLFERARELKPVGAGISLQPNAMQAIDLLGIADRVAKKAYAAENARILRWDGKPLKKFSFRNYKDQYGFLPYTIHRADLIQVLADSIDNSNAEICLNSEIVRFSVDSEGVIAETSNQRSVRGDALIGADGIRSNIRKQLWNDGDPRYAGYTCWRGVVSDQNLVAKAETLTELWGSGARFGYMRCNDHQIYWFATRNRAELNSDNKDDDWKNAFSKWTDPVSQIIEATPADKVVNNDIVDRPPIFPWGKDNVTLMGDAAHAMTPNFGQGGAQALEDAAVLGKMLENATPENVSDRLRRYESVRHPRTETMVTGSEKYGKIAQGTTWMRRVIRNSLLPNLPKKFVDSQLQKQFDFDSHLQHCQSMLSQ